VCKFSYGLGACTVLLVAAVPLLRAGHELGYERFARDAWNVLAFWREKHEKVMALPEGLRAELMGLHAVVGNAGNPTNQKKHDTLLVAPDSDLGWCLRPDVRLQAHVLKSIQPVNLDPPVLYLPTNATVSDPLASYLRSQSRGTYSIATTAQGLRRTMPETRADRKLLIVGDSVAFGLGVDDSETIASHLQKRVGARLEVWNAGVGSYDGLQACRMARRLAAETRFSGLVYVACQNDFMSRRHDQWSAKAEKTLAQLEKLAPRFQDRVVVLFHTYLEREARDVLLTDGWTGDTYEQTEVLRRDVARLSREKGFTYLDWPERVDGYCKGNDSILAPFALYADHCHLSPLGCRLAAAAIRTALVERGLVPAAPEDEPPCP